MIVVFLVICKIPHTLQVEESGSAPDSYIADTQGTSCHTGCVWQSDDALADSPAVFLFVFVMKHSRRW